MLLRNESKVLYNASIDLFFDDGTEKHVIVDINDTVTIKYIKDGLVNEDSGVISDIILLYKTTNPTIDFREPYDCTCHAQHVTICQLWLDKSTVCNSSIEKINIDDILDITLPSDEISDSEESDNDEDIETPSDDTDDTPTVEEPTTNN